MLKEKIKELRRAVKKLGIFNCDIKPVNKILFEIIEEAEDIMWIRELYYKEEYSYFKKFGVIKKD